MNDLETHSPLALVFITLQFQRERHFSLKLCAKMSFCQLLLFMLVKLASQYSFTDDNWNSFDAYGVKMAATDALVVQARNNDAQFVVQFYQFDISNLSLPCYVEYPGISTGDKNFIYNIVVPDQPSDSASVVFVGENSDSSTSPYPFVGHLMVDSSCNNTVHMHYFVPWGHDEFYVASVDPPGNVAYGFSSRFAFRYDLVTHNITYFLAWPISSFTPRAADVNIGHIVVVAGFVAKPQSTGYQPWAYSLEMDNTSFSVIDQWGYVPANNSWQAKTSNSDAANFTKKHIMSVSIHGNTSQVLIGIPSMNVVFWFQLTPNLNFTASRESGYQRGYGQTVGWNQEVGGPYPVILGNTYSFPYEWSSSVIYWFTLVEFLPSDPIMPLFPTVQCPRWVDLGQEMIAIATTPLNVAILDSSGQIYVLMSTAQGHYPGTTTAIGTNPAFSSPTPCPVGMYKSWIGVDICYPCAMGTMSDVEGSIECAPYDCDETNSLCPLGSLTNDTYSDMIVSVSQDQTYPKSPDSTIFDDILIQNMFSFGNSTRCLAISPIFWTMVTAGIAIIFLLVMCALKFLGPYAKVRDTCKQILRHADIIKEGEMWIGGLASFSLIILIGFAYIFSNAYLQEYPIETAPAFTFACDTTIRNAKFSTSLQPLSTPRSEDDQPIYDLLDEQNFTLTVDFINTNLNCDAVHVTQTIHGNSKSLAVNCNYSRSVLSVSLILGSHSVALYYNFDHALPMSGLRVSLYGEKLETNNARGHRNYLVNEINFSQPFFVNNQILASDPTIELSLTPVINETSPLADDGTYYYSALWVPMSVTSTPELFLTSDQFLYYGLLKPTLSISISKTSYFIQNLQSPITKQTEVVFHNLLFTIVCLELFGLGFIAAKLIFLPLFNVLRHFVEKYWKIVHPEHASISPEFTIDNVKEKQCDRLDPDKPSTSRDLAMTNMNQKQENIFTAKQFKTTVQRFLKTKQTPVTTI